MADEYAGSSHEEMDNYYRRMDDFGRRSTVDHSIRNPAGECTACNAGNGPHPEDAPPLGIWQHCRNCGENGYHSFWDCPAPDSPARAHSKLYRQVMPEPEGRSAQDAYEKRLFGE